jgi:ABC-type transporter Mla subunit MlaD
MLGTLEDVLGALDRLSAEMAREDAPPIEELVASVARRQALVERIAAFQPLDPAIAERLEHIVRLGNTAASRLNSARESLRRDIEEMDRMRRFAEGLGHTVPERAPRLNTRG